MRQPLIMLAAFATTSLACCLSSTCTSCATSPPLITQARTCDFDFAASPVDDAARSPHAVTTPYG
ncbi:hypothetical protein ACFQY4_32885 [Catellatospora bangladeshensis]|uniref:hypothetical protein n=1 Tax=Catellatospora bangladeshensis TaxID=310355 RepID=UPI003613C344